jgi:hypothetical protein
MRFVSSLPPATASPVSRQVRRVAAATAVKPVFPPEQSGPGIEPVAAQQNVAHLVEQQHQRTEPFEDRRKACRRVSHQPVLVDLRSGPDRRRHNLRADDLVDHIDETV